MLERQDLIAIRGLVREEVTEKFDLLDKRMGRLEGRFDGLEKKFEQSEFDIAEMIEESILPQIDRLSDKIDMFSANFVRKSEMNIAMDDFRREMKAKRRSKR